MSEKTTPFPPTCSLSHADVAVLTYAQKYDVNMTCQRGRLQLEEGFHRVKETKMSCSKKNSQQFPMSESESTLPLSCTLRSDHPQPMQRGKEKHKQDSVSPFQN